MDKKINILISNDDGVHSEGIMALYRELQTIANVTVVAPDRDRSGASNSLTLTRPIRIKNLDNSFISVEGTPTDCVYLAISELLEHKPDFVVSGINYGPNLGSDVLYSGTVAAASQGSFLGYPSIAVSLNSKDNKNLRVAAKVTKNIILSLKEKVLPVKNTLINVNVPDVPSSELQGFDITRLGSRYNASNVIKTQDPRGLDIYWIGPPGMEQDAGPGTDFYALKAKKVSITPLRFDLTNYKLFENVAEWLSFFNDNELT